jgi:hypothetical protein
MTYDLSIVKERLKNKVKSLCASVLSFVRKSDFSGRGAADQLRNRIQTRRRMKARYFSVRTGSVFVLKKFK